MTESADHHVVAIIPARGGSKSIPRKNLQDLGGKPLVAWPIELAKSIPQISRVIVSTDDAEIADTAKKYGAEVPFFRPSELSADDIPTLPVLQHTLEYLKVQENYQVDIVILLYPTTPFLKKERILEGITLLQQDACKSVVGAKIVHGLLWKKDTATASFKPFYPEQRVNRQQFEHLYEEAGNIYFSKASVLQQENKIIDDQNCYFVLITAEEDLDIDAPEDLVQARELVREWSA